MVLFHVGVKIYELGMFVSDGNPNLGSMVLAYKDNNIK
jgi:hypothetical protein